MKDSRMKERIYGSTIGKQEDMYHYSLFIKSEDYKDVAIDIREKRLKAIWKLSDEDILRLETENYPNPFGN